MRRYFWAATAAVATTALLGGAGTAQAQGSLTCQFTGVIDMSGGTYDWGGPARCVGRIGNFVAIPSGPGSNANWSSNGFYTGDPCVSGVLGDLSGANTVLQFTNGSFSLTNVGYTINAVGGVGEISFAGSGLVGEGVIHFTRPPLVCSPGTGPLNVNGSFTIALT